MAKHNKHMVKRIASILLVFCMILGGGPGGMTTGQMTVFAEEAEQEQALVFSGDEGTTWTYDGVTFTGWDQNYKGESGTWEWYGTATDQYNAHTLILDGFELETSQTGISFGESDTPVTVIYRNENKIRSSGGAAIKSASDLRLIGETGAESPILNLYYAGAENNGIDAEKNLWIRQGFIQVTSDNRGESGQDGATTSGIRCENLKIDANSLTITADAAAIKTGHLYLLANVALYLTAPEAAVTGLDADTEPEITTLPAQEITNTNLSLEEYNKSRTFFGNIIPEDKTGCVRLFTDNSIYNKEDTIQIGEEVLQPGTKDVQCDLKEYLAGGTGHYTFTIKPGQEAEIPDWVSFDAEAGLFTIGEVPDEEFDGTKITVQVNNAEEDLAQTNPSEIYVTIGSVEASEEALVFSGEEGVTWTYDGVTFTGWDQDYKGESGTWEWYGTATDQYDAHTLVLDGFERTTRGTALTFGESDTPVTVIYRNRTKITSLNGNAIKSASDLRLIGERKDDSTPDLNLYYTGAEYSGIDVEKNLWIVDGYVSVLSNSEDTDQPADVKIAGIRCESLKTKACYLYVRGNADAIKTRHLYVLADSIFDLYASEAVVTGLDENTVPVITTLQAREITNANLSLEEYNADSVFSGNITPVDKKSFVTLYVSGEIYSTDSIQIGEAVLQPGTKNIVCDLNKYLAGGSGHYTFTVEPEQQANIPDWVSFDAEAGLFTIDEVPDEKFDGTEITVLVNNAEEELVQEEPSEIYVTIGSVEASPVFIFSGEEGITWGYDGVKFTGWDQNYRGKSGTWAWYGTKTDQYDAHTLVLDAFQWKTEGTAFSFGESDTPVTVIFRNRNEITSSNGSVIESASDLRLIGEKAEKMPYLDLYYAGAEYYGIDAEKNLSICNGEVRLTSENADGDQKEDAKTSAIRCRSLKMDTGNLYVTADATAIKTGHLYLLANVALYLTAPEAAVTGLDADTEPEITTLPAQEITNANLSLEEYNAGSTFSGKILPADGKEKVILRTTYKIYCIEEEEVQIGEEPLQPLTKNIRYNVRGYFMGGTGKYTFQVKPGQEESIPDWVSIDAETGLITIDEVPNEKFDGVCITIQVNNAEKDLAQEEPAEINVRIGSVTPAKMYTLTFSDRGKITTRQVREGQVLGILENPKITEYDGCEFMGWYTDSEYTRMYDTTAAVNSDMTFYAKWKSVSDNAYLSLEFADYEGLTWTYDGVTFTGWDQNYKGESGTWEWYGTKTGEYGAHTLVLDNFDFDGLGTAVIIGDSDIPATIILKNYNKICAEKAIRSGSPLTIKGQITQGEDGSKQTGSLDIGIVRKSSYAIEAYKDLNIYGEEIGTLTIRPVSTQVLSDYDTCGIRCSQNLKAEESNLVVQYGYMAIGTKHLYLVGRNTLQLLSSYGITGTNPDSDTVITTVRAAELDNALLWLEDYNMNSTFNVMICPADRDQPMILKTAGISCDAQDELDKMKELQPGMKNITLDLNTCLTGGTGSYTFALAEDSEKVPDWVTFDAASGKFTITEVPEDAEENLYVTVAVNNAEEDLAQKNPYRVQVPISIAGVAPTYTLTLNDRDQITVRKVKGGTTIGVLDAPDASNDGYTFVCWCTDSELTTEYDKDAPITGDITLYAKWKKNETNQGNGGNGTSGDGQNQDNSTSGNGQNPDNGTSGDRQNPDNGTSGSGQNPDTGTAGQGSTVYQISYVLGKGTNNAKNPSSYIGTQQVTLYAPSRKGYTFDGWYTDSSYKHKITSIETGTTQDITLYAKWTKVTVKKTATPKLSGKKGGSLIVRYNKVSGVKGYEILVSSNAKFKKNKKVIRTGKTKATVKKLKKKTVYYVKVRAYKIDSTGSKVYGKYSAVKKIRITK